MTTINRWCVYCETDSKYEDVYLPDTEAAPTQCPTDTAHTITAAKTFTKEVITDLLPIQMQADGGQAIKIDPLQHPPGWTYLSLGFLAEVTANQTAPFRQVFYFLVADELGAAMDIRAWTGKMVPEGCNIRDKMKVELVVKGSAVGGLDDTHDIVLDQFVRDMHPSNQVIREFTPPDKSMLIPTGDASKLNPALPPVPIYFKMVYEAVADTGVDQCVTFDLEGFEPPAGS